MATFDATIRTASPAQGELQRRREHCSADPGRLAAIGSAVGHQVRIARSADRQALYPVSESRQENPDTIVRMGPPGRRRLGTSREFAATVDSQVPHPTISEARAEAEQEFIERLRDDGRQSRLIAIAPHGGEIEPRTDRQAERVRSRLGAGVASAWRCKGWGEDEGDAFLRWHITSTDIEEASFPRLRSVISRGFAHAVAFHGFEDPEILIGGTAPPELKEAIRGAIERATAASRIEVRIAGPEDEFGGDDPGNIVNRLSPGGLQIEQSLRARLDHWPAIANAVADVYRPLL
jgi:phage replication-related protein YjqB (UPF0714/DUF867 family)